MNKLKLLLPILFIASNIMGQENESPINVEALYVAEQFSNFSGGIKTGQTYLGLIDFGLGFNTEDLGLWKNGEFFILMENTHGGSPSGEYVGDIQVASNIENGDFTYLYELWYKQQFNKLGLKAGIMDLNADCHVSELGGHFINSSFGIMPSASLNMPVPIFPLPALGILADYNFSESFQLLAGVWDGDPGDFETNRYNIEWSIDNREGFLYMIEGHYHLGTKSTIKLGSIYHSGSFSPFDTAQFINGELRDTIQSEKGNLEFHLIAEHKLIDKGEGEKGNLAAFIQLGYTPDYTISHTPVYVGAGLNYTGLLKKTADDVLGLGFAYIGISPEIAQVDQYKNFEMAVELSYSLPVFNNITIQPDFQYIINPGADKDLDNAFAGFLRIIIEH